MATMNIVHDSNAQFNPPSLSELLEPYAPGYVLVYAPGELKPTPILDDAGKRTGRWTKTAAAGKEPIRGEWQRNPQTYKQAAARARRGGNVGLMGGAGNLVILDLDADRDGKLAKWPELATTVEVYRDTGPDRGKFIVHIDGPLPPSVKNHTVGLEILSTGTQGVIYGRHQSGARILHRGDAILTTTATRVMQFWVDCGCELPDDKRADAGPPDAEAVKRSIEVADAVMLAAGRTGDGGEHVAGIGRALGGAIIVSAAFALVVGEGVVRHAARGLLTRAHDLFVGPTRAGLAMSPMMGRHNVRNALGSIALLSEGLGQSATALMRLLTGFQGVKRRQDLRGTARGVRVYDDFAHHPTAIATTIDGLRRAVGSARILAVLEPRSNTMKLGAMKDRLVASLEGAERSYCYAANLGWDAAGALAPLGPRASVHEDLDDLVAAVVRDARPGDHVLVMSNGGFGGVHGKLLGALQARGGTVPVRKASG